MSESFKYDVFLSHSSKDKPAVRELAERLKADGLRVWFDEWEIRAGDHIQAKIEEGLKHSRVLVLCMSAQAFDSDWAQLESYTFRFRDPLNKGRRFIPLRLDNAPLKDTLEQFKYVDWQQKSNEEYNVLLNACRLPVVATTPAIERKGEPSPSKIFKGHISFVECVVVTADGQRAISCSKDKTVRVWEIDTGKCLAILKGHTSDVRGLAVTPDGRHIISGSKDYTARVWEMPQIEG